MSEPTDRKSNPSGEPDPAVGTLCEGIAHQFNNLLARIMACAEGAQEGDIPPNVGQDLRTIVASCEEAGTLTERLLCYAGHVPLLRRPVDPTNLLEHTLQMLEGELLEAGIEVTRDYKSIPDMLLDNVQIGRMLRNVITNAIDAMPRGGRLHVTCGTEDNELVVTIKDTGSGIPEGLLDRVFLPFVTTKGVLSGSDQPGTGLGLCVCRGIVTRHHGHISLDSTPGNGTTVTIRIPLEQSNDLAPPGESYGAPS